MKCIDFSVENAAVGTSIGRVTATDADLTAQFSAVTYRIQHHAEHSPFTVNRTTGELRTAGQLDREAMFDNTCFSVVFSFKNTRFEPRFQLTCQKVVKSN